MSITSELLSLTQQQAQIQQTAQHANLMQAQTAAINRQAAVDQQTRAIAQQYALARENAASVSAGGPGAPKATGLDANPDLQDINQRIAQRTSDYNNFSTLSSKLMAGGGDLKLAQQYDDNARLAQEDITAEQTRALEVRKNLIGNMASVAGAASADNWQDTKAQLDSIAPGWDRGKNLDFDPLNGGEVTWGPRTQRAMAALADQGQTAYQQAEMKWRAAQEARLSQQADTEAKRQATYERDVDSKIATRRSNVERADDKARQAKLPKEPTVHEVSDLAADLASQHDLSDSQSRLMASDILRRRNEIMAHTPGTSNEDATTQATQEAEARVKEAESTGGVLGFFKTYTPASYTRVGKATLAADATKGTPEDKTASAVVQPFTKAGVPVEYTNGVLTSKGGNVPMTDALYNQLPSGTVFLGPDGKKHRKP